jgi:N-dimethylarginine dimethylaminohydrolase
MSSPEILREIEAQLRARGIEVIEDELSELEAVYAGLRDWIGRVERLAERAPA